MNGKQSNESSADSRAIMFHIGVATQAPPLPENHGLSDWCVDFIERCLTLEPPERPTATEMLKHEWLGGMVAELVRDALRSLASPLNTE